MVLLLSQRVFLIVFHIILITLSNILVQYPFQLLGFHTTWGAFTYPIIFLLSDLTVRLNGQQTAKIIVFKAMLPAFFISYLCAALFGEQGFQGIVHFNLLAFRIALASFSAYILGQLLDITVFQRLRSSKRWWIAPMGSTFVGNIVDTFTFFFIAFYRCGVPALQEHWLEIASVDLVFKIVISLVLFIPLYGLVLMAVVNQIKFSNP